MSNSCDYVIPDKTILRLTIYSVFEIFWFQGFLLCSFGLPLTDFMLVSTSSRIVALLFIRVFKVFGDLALFYPSHRPIVMFPVLYLLHFTCFQV